METNWSKYWRLRSKTEDKEYEINIFDFSNINEDFRLYWGSTMLIYPAKNIEINTNSVIAKKIRIFELVGKWTFIDRQKINGTDRKLRFLAFKRCQNHKNPRRINAFHGRLKIYKNSEKYSKIPKM